MAFDFDRQPDDEPRADADLDELLAHATWPEPSRESTERLAARWRELRDVARPAMGRIGWLVTAAAAVVLAAGGAWWLIRAGESPRPLLATQTPQYPFAREAIPHPVAREDWPRPNPVAPIIARPATPAERFALLATTPPQRPAARPAPAEVTAAIDAALAAVGGEKPEVLALRSLPGGEVGRRLASIATSPGEPPERRAAAVRVLGRVARPETLPLLLRYAADAEFAHDAMPGVARLAGENHLLRFARSPKPPVRQAAMRELLGLGTDAAVAHFLSLVLDPQTRPAAQEALHAAPRPPVDALVRALDHRRVDYRLAAAKSLGALCDSAGVGPTLRRMVKQNQNRREALAALTSCPDKAAADFLAAARTWQSIDAELRAVQSEMANLF